MKAVVLLVAALAMCAPGQSQDGRGVAARQALRDDLISLSGKSNTSQLKQQLLDHTFLLAEPTHEPVRATAQSFVNELADALASRPLAPSRAAGLAEGITLVMQSAGTSTSGFLDVVSEFKRHLLGIGVTAAQAHSVATRLERMGMEVRGPEGVPVR
jgi:hypothetical protein